MRTETLLFIHIGRAHEVFHADDNLFTLAAPFSLDKGNINIYI